MLSYRPIILVDMNVYTQPKEQEKTIYNNHNQGWLTAFSIISFVGAFISSSLYFSTSPYLHIFYAFLFFSSVYYLISLFVNGFGKKFDYQKHLTAIRGWQPGTQHNVDIFLPTCGEDLSVLKNTWEGVAELCRYYKGVTKVYCLDDGVRPEVKSLAENFKFSYLTRENPRYLKKAGNLHHGYKNSQGEYIAIFDADFRPSKDFLYELMPYFDRNPKLGIVQSPQFFDVHNQQNWLERGAGAVQEYFYRSIQHIRNSHNGAICVGSNAIYRRAALADNDGPTMIDHSEDVHTGFDLGQHGWQLLYVPVVLAKGICPSELRSFFRQQYRWCKGSMSLLFSKKFWVAKLTIRQRLCYFSGFFYYLHTGLATIVAPLIPLSLLFLVPEQARLVNYLLLLPAFLYSVVIFPMWHKCRYNWETLGVKMIYGWSHLFAIADTMTRRTLEWEATGSTSSKSVHFAVWRACLLIFAVPVAVLWVGGAIYYMITWSPLNFLPTLILGELYGFTVLRVCLLAFSKGPQDKIAPYKYLLPYFVVLALVMGWALKTLVITPTVVAAHVDDVKATVAETVSVEEPVKTIEEPAVAPSKEVTQSYSFNVAKGDSWSTLARKAVNKYSADNNIELLPWQRMAVETKLAASLKSQSLRINSEVQISTSLIAQALQQIESQTRHQIAMWQGYVRAAGLK